MQAAKRAAEAGVFQTCIKHSEGVYGIPGTVTSVTPAVARLISMVSLWVTSWTSKLRHRRGDWRSW